MITNSEGIASYVSFCYKFLCYKSINIYSFQFLRHEFEFVQLLTNLHTGVLESLSSKCETFCISKAMEDKRKTAKLKSFTLARKCLYLLEKCCPLHHYY